MKLMSKISTLLFVLQVINGIACNCPPFKDHDALIKISFESYPQVFLGEIFKKDNVFWIRVTEVFKGYLNVGDEIKAVTEWNSCSFNFGQEGLGLFYGYEEENEFTTTICSPTRTFEYPYLYPPNPPPMPGTDTTTKEKQVNRKLYEETEEERLKYEIKELRKKTGQNNK